MHGMNDSYESVALPPPPLPDGCSGCGIRFDRAGQPEPAALRIGFKSRILNRLVAYKCSECGHIQEVEHA